MKNLVLSIFFLSFINISFSQEAEDLVRKIALENRVEEKYIGLGESELYQSFEMLKKKASKKELLELLNHDSLAVKIYAIYAIVDRELIKPSTLFEQYLNDDAPVTVHSGCIEPKSKSIPSLIYFRYLSTRYEYPKDNGVEGAYSNAIFRDSKELEKMDSLILYSDNPETLLYRRAFYNRVYSKKYQKRIEEWAFRKKEIVALRYVYENLYQGNELKIKQTIFELLQKENITAFEKSELEEVLQGIKQKD